MLGIGFGLHFNLLFKFLKSIIKLTRLTRIVLRAFCYKKQ